MNVDDLSFSDPDFLIDPYPTFAALRAEAAVQWHEPTQMWLALTHRTASDVLRSRSLGRLWSPRFPEISMPAFELIHVHSLLESEPPVHTRLRRLIAGAFSRGHVERLRPAIDALAARLAGDLAAAAAAGEPVDLIAHYAEPLPVEVIAELLGIPPVDRHHLRPWSNAIVKMYEYGITDAQRDAAERASADFVEYLRELVERRRVEPGDDLISSLLAEADADGTRLSLDELVTTGTLLLNAGHEATVNVVGNGFSALLARPDVLATVRDNLDDDAFVATAVEELIRFDSPLQLFERTATADVEIGGAVVEKGQKIAALLGAANRDPAVFAAPDVLDPSRDPNPQIGFGAGIHFCVGAPLARIELQTTLRTLLSSFPELTLAAPPPRRPEFVIRGVEQLLVTTG